MADEKVMQWIQRDLDGDLSADEQRMLEAVLAGSPEDARLREEMRKLSVRLSSLPKVEPPVSVAERVLEEIELERKPKGRAGRPGINRMRLAAAAAAVVLGLGGWMAVRQNDEAVHRVSIRMDPAGNAGSGRTESAPSFSAADSAESKALSVPAEGVPSPDGRYAARWENGVLVIRTADGTERYRSRPFSDKAAPEILWQSGRVLRLSWPASGKTVMVDVEAGREKR